MPNGVYFTTFAFLVSIIPAVLYRRLLHAKCGNVPMPQRRTIHEIAITAIGAPKYYDHYNQESSNGSKRIWGIGSDLDLLYIIPIELEGKIFPVNLDTGSSDLWLISDTCVDNACNGSTVVRYPASSFQTTDIYVNMLYGDSKSATYASGVIGHRSATVAGITMTSHPFALIQDTSNLLVRFGATGIFGLGFPAASSIQAAFTKATRPKEHPFDLDNYVDSMQLKGPLLSRISMSDNMVAEPMFTISLKRHTTGLDGRGSLIIGSLPEGVDNSTLTWVPVRLYAEDDGGMGAPTYSPNEVYPYRWEIDIEGVFLDGQNLLESTISARDVDSKRVSALIDSGNSLIRGPEDIVFRILKTVSPRFDPGVIGSVPSLHCNTPRILSFQIGGQMFPIDPRDFVSQLDQENAVVCQADNIVPADSPGYGNLFRWSLGTPFFRSNLIAFYYGNLTHPSSDPPRIGFLSNVPSNASLLLLKEAINEAQRR